MDDREDLSAGDLVAGASVSYVTLFCSLWLFLVSRASDITAVADPEILLWTVVFMAYATPVWLAVMIFAGVPLAFWIERRTPVGSTPFRRFAPYVMAGAAIGGVFYPLHPLALPISVVCASTSRLGAEWWKSRRRRVSDGATVNLA